MPSPVSFRMPPPYKPQTPQGIDEHLREISLIVRSIMDGKINAAFDFELTVSPAVSTTITDERIRETTRVLLHPVNAHAANDWHAGTVKVIEGNIKGGFFIVDHLPSTLVRSFRASLLS